MKYTTKDGRDDDGQPFVEFTFTETGKKVILAQRDYPSGKAMIEAAIKAAST